MANLSAATSAPAETNETLEELLKSWVAHTEASTGALHTLVGQLPGINQLLENSFIDISGGFLDIAQHFRAMTEDSTPLSPAQQEHARHITKKIGELVMALQFQDRVSQNLVITFKIVDAIMRSQQMLLSQTKPILAEDARESLLKVEFAKELLNLLNLGELRHSYAHYLQQHHLIQDASLFGGLPSAPASGANQQDDDDVELF